MPSEAREIEVLDYRPPLRREEIPPRPFWQDKPSDFPRRKGREEVDRLR